MNTAMRNPNPLKQRVLCQAVLTEETLPNHVIILLSDQRERMASQQAEVVAIGPEVHDVQPGDWILHTDFARTYVDDDLFVVQEDDVLAKLELVE